MVEGDAAAGDDSDRNGDWAWSAVTDKFSAKESASAILRKEYTE
ncbi:MAG: hypothetical protein ACK5PZ_19875 [Pirellula sp.]|jgi:hypothetical protein